MTSAKTFSIGGFTLPVSNNALKEMGDAVHNFSLEPIVFNFVFRGIRFRCACKESEAGARVEIAGQLGAIPFTAQSSYGRLAALSLVKAAHRDLKGMINVMDGTIILKHHKDITSPVTATSLITAIVTTLTTAMPYISLLFEIIGQPKTKLPPLTDPPPLSHPKV